MSWNPDGKISNFGESFETMLIPETSDPVLGEDDPGATPVAISAMAEFQGQAWGKITNNVQFLKRRILTEDLNLTISTPAEFLEAKEAIEIIEHIDEGVTLTLSFSSGFSLSGSSTYFPMEINGITGGGAIALAGYSASPFTLHSIGNDSVLSFSQVEPTIMLQYGTFGTGSTSAIDLVHVENCKNIFFISCEFNNVAVGDVVALYIGGMCTAGLLSITFGEYYGTHVYGEYGAIINVNGCYFDRPNTGGKNINISYFCNLHWAALNDTDFLMGSTASEVDLFYVDATCNYTASSYGLGGSGTVTFSDTGSTYLLRDVQRFINCMPKKIDANVTLELPDDVTAFDNSNGDIVLDGFYCPTGDKYISIVPQTTVVGPSTAQNVTIEVDGANKNGIEITNCKVHIIIDSLALSSDDSHGIYIGNSGSVTVQNCYLLTDDTTGDDGIHFTQDSTGFVDSCVFGDCGNNGIEANYRSHVHGDTCERVDASNQPVSYGVLAQSGSVISYNSTGWTLTGGSGAAYAATGGETRS